MAVGRRAPVHRGLPVPVLQSQCRDDPLLPDLECHRSARLCRLRAPASGAGGRDARAASA